EFVVVGVGGALLIKQLAAGPLYRARRGGVARQLLDTPQQCVPAGNRTEDRAGVIVLPLQERQPVGVLVVLHPSIWCLEGLAEVRVLDYLNTRDRRRRNARSRTRSAPGSQRHECRAGADEHFPSIDRSEHCLGSTPAGLPEPSPCLRPAAKARGLFLQAS